VTTCLSTGVQSASHSARLTQDSFIGVQGSAAYSYTLLQLKRLEAITVDADQRTAASATSCITLLWLASCISWCV
jgi:hypothetical protein